MNQDDSVSSVAHAFDGRDAIKFRIMAAENLSNKQAKELMMKFMAAVSNHSTQDSDTFWTRYDLEFDIKSQENGEILFHGRKFKEYDELFWIF